MAEPNKKPLLDLNTLVERPKIRIDGRDYEMLAPDQLSILDQQRFANWGREVTEIAQDGDAEALQAKVDEIIDTILIDVPETIRAKLSRMHRMEIVSVFTGLLFARKMAATGAMAEGMMRQIGAKSSPGSSASMAARHRGGSKKRQRR